MAKPFRKKIVEYRLADGSACLPDGTRVKKSTPGAVPVVTESPCYYGTVNGKQVRLAETMERSKRMLDKLRGDVHDDRAGTRDRFAHHRNRPILEHLQDFKKVLESKGSSPGHIRQTISECEKVIKGCKWELIEDLDSTDVLDYLAGLRGSAGKGAPELPPGQERFTVHEVAHLLGINPQSVRRMEQRGFLAAATGTRKKRTYARADVETMLAQRVRGISIESSNHYLKSIKAFSKWLARKKRAPSYELMDLEPQNAETDRRHERRALPPEDFETFLEATASGRTFRGLTGPARIVLYCVAARTGLRASELASLTPDSLDLDASPPTVTVQAAYSKHRREDVLPLRADTAELLRAWCRDVEPGSPLWPGSWPEAGAEMIRQDLEAAGIPYRDRKGRVLDFHGLRHTFLTHMASSGIHPKVAQVLARHSTITLTMDRYTHLDVLNMAGDLERLPALPVPGEKSTATGQKAKARPG